MACIGDEPGLSKKESFKLNSLLRDISINLILVHRLCSAIEAVYRDRTISVDDEKYKWVPLTLLQTELKNEYHEAMQDLRSRLRDVCAEYQAAGSTARLLYQKEQPKERNISRQLTTYASGRWNPLADPSSPITGALNEHQRLKLASRHRCPTEVLRFDGKILRSSDFKSVSNPHSNFRSNAPTGTHANSNHRGVTSTSTPPTTVS